MSASNRGIAIVELGEAFPPSPTVTYLEGRQMEGIDFDAVRGLAYVSDRDRNQVFRLDLDTDLLWGEPLAVGEPGRDRLAAVCVDPAEGRFLYLLSQGPADDRVYAVDRDSWAVAASAALAPDCGRMVISPDGTLLYVTERSEGEVIVVDAGAVTNGVQGDEIVASIPAGVNPSWLCLAPDRQRLYVTNLGSSDLSIIDTDPASPTRFQKIQDFPTLPGPAAMDITPDGSRAYLASRLDKAGEVQVILLHELP